MKKYVIAALAAAGLFAFSTTDASAQYYYGGYYGYYPSSPGISINFGYYDSPRHRYRHHHRRYDRYRHYDRYHHRHRHHHRRGYGRW